VSVALVTLSVIVSLDATRRWQIRLRHQRYVLRVQLIRCSEVRLGHCRLRVIDGGKSEVSHSVIEDLQLLVLYGRCVDCFRVSVWLRQSFPSEVSEGDLLSSPVLRAPGSVSGEPSAPGC
jgi:hypothetical protein